MKNELILVPSVTYAMKAKSILDKAAIRSYIQRTPKNTKIRSCGYRLFVPHRADEAEKILRERGVRVLGRAERDPL